MSDPPPNAKRLVLAAGGTGLVLFLWYTRFGLGISPDSVAYVTAARSLLAGHGFQRAGEAVYRLWAPLYPIVLAGLRMVSRDLVGVARWFQAIGYAATLGLCAAILVADLERRWVAVAATVLCVVSPAVLVASGRVASEPLYLLSLMAIVYLYPRATASGRCRDLLWIVVPTALCAFQRYSGIFVIFAVSLYLVLEAGPWTRRQRWSRALFFGAASSGPLLAWMVRNLIVVGNLAGHRRGPHQPLGDSLRRGFVVPGGFWVPHWLHGWVGGAVIALLLVALVLALLPPATSRRLPRLTTRIRLAGFIAFVHLALSIAAAVSTALTPIALRYVSPSALGFVLLLAGVVDDLAHRPAAGRWRTTAAAFGIAVFALFGATSTFRVAKRIVTVGERRSITPLSEQRWRSSPVLAWVRAMEPSEVMVVTNAPWLVRFYANPRHMALRDLGRIDAALRRASPGCYVVLDKGREHDVHPKVEALIRSHAGEIRLRGPNGVLLSPSGSGCRWRPSAKGDSHAGRRRGGRR